jgi:IrrE N-terminal-like domain
MTTVRRWSEQLIAGLDSAAIDRVAANPKTALTDVFGITVVATSGFDARGAGGWCDGVSLLDGNKILYRPTPSRRENFTLCHELGHYLAESDNGCLDWLGDLPDGERVLESLCDAIAARLLIPDSARSAALADGPSAEALIELFNMTGASRSACAVAIANALPTEGFVAVVDAEAPDSVFFGARAAETRPYAWAGDAIPESHPLARLFEPRRCHTYWPTRDGGQRNFYMSGAVHGSWNIGVFSSDNLWGIEGGNFVDPGEPSRRNDETIKCPCGYRGVTPWWPCDSCGIPTCPSCGECQCDRDRRLLPTAMCQECTSTVRAHLLQDGLCPACR